VEQHFHQVPRAVLVSLPDNTNCTNRMGGFWAGVKSVNSKAVLVAEPNGDRLTLPSENVMADVIQSGKPFNIVTACNGDSQLGALDALRAAGRGQAVNKVPKTEYVFGIDGTTPQIEELLSSTSPLMQVLGLDPVTNTISLLNTMIKEIHHQIPQTYRGSVYDTVLNPNCAVTNAWLKAAYGTTVACHL